MDLKNQIESGLWHASDAGVYSNSVHTTEIVIKYVQDYIDEFSQWHMIEIDNLKQEIEELKVELMMAQNDILHTTHGDVSPRGVHIKRRSIYNE